jgi:hypothetical protein
MECWNVGLNKVSLVFPIIPLFQHSSIPEGVKIDTNRIHCWKIG